MHSLAKRFKIFTGKFQANEDFIKVVAKSADDSSRTFRPSSFKRRAAFLFDSDVGFVAGQAAHFKTQAHVASTLKVIRQFSDDLD